MATPIKKIDPGQRPEQKIESGNPGALEKSDVLHTPGGEMPDPRQNRIKKEEVFTEEELKKAR